ncbi:MAG: alanine--tRNA ligase [Candidatus Portnoybacteria bacterium]|nr:alanine--tRNA ligase [Candidatus Portnoybacteria bacterium]
MTANDLREKFLKFFKDKGHKIIPSASLIPEHDPSVLFTTAGMQQFKAYYLGEKSTYGDRVCSVQKCFRTSDIDEVGDERHLTFFEMLGNFSFKNAYFKKEAIEYAYEFIVKEMGLKIDYVTIFKGDSWMKLGQKVPQDAESEKIWREIRQKNNENFEIRKFGKEDNFWGPTGNEGPCGPTTEIYVNGIEIWNLVFNEYYGKEQDGNWIVKNWNRIVEGKGHRDLKLTKLRNPGVDTGMGLERLAMVKQGKNNVFETDLFSELMEKIDSLTYLGHQNAAIRAGDMEEGASSESKRIVADHMKAAVFMISDGTIPSNIGRGYVLRRLIRRTTRHIIRQTIRHMGNLIIEKGNLVHLADVVIEQYGNVYENLRINREKIREELRKEEEKFENTLENSLREFRNLAKKKEESKDLVLTGAEAAYLYQTCSMSVEDTKELAKEYGLKLADDFDVVFEKKMKEHQELSRTASAGMFKGGLADASEATVKYHTAAHLMLAALRQVLGNHVVQKGSNITAERLRFDFSHPQKVTPEEIKQVEDLVNQKIGEDLPVQTEEMTLEEAKQKGAMGVFESKYGERVKVYTIGGPSPEAGSRSPFSQEICGGPHVKKTGQLGKFKIIKEESAGAGVRRIKAILE